MSLENTKFQKWFLVLYFIFFCLFIIRIGHGFSIAQKFVPSSLGGRVTAWLLCVESRKETGSFLTVLDEKKRVRPLIGIDIGYPLILNTLALIKPIDHPLITLVKVNQCINALSILILSLCFSFWISKIMGLAILAVSPYYMIAGPYAGLDIYNIFDGLFFFILIALILIQKMISKRWDCRWHLILIYCLTWLILGGVTMLRLPIGLAGILSALGLVSLNLKKFLAKGKRGTSSLALILLMILSSYYMHKSVFLIRDSYYHFPKTEHTNHGISHTLYLGLGTHQNPWGIKWDDEFAFNKVRKERPGIEIYSNQYFSYLWRSYFKIVTTTPFSVLKYYLVKLKICFGPARVSAWEFAVIILLSLILAHRYAVFPHPDLVALCPIVAVFSTLFLLQGVLTYSADSYSYPTRYGYLFFWGLFVLIAKGVDKRVFRWSLAISILSILFLGNRLWYEYPFHFLPLHSGSFFFKLYFSILMPGIKVMASITKDFLIVITAVYFFTSFDKKRRRDMKDHKHGTPRAKPAEPL